MKMMTIVEGKVPPEKHAELEHIFEDMKRGPKPEGLLKSYLIKKQNSDICQIIGVWADMESIMSMRAKGLPAALVAFSKIGVEPTLSMYELLNEITP
jgi:hypothetical protein